MKFLTAFAAFCALCSSAFAANLDALAGRLLKSEAELSATPALSKEFAAPDSATAYAIQKKYIDTKLAQGEKIAGFKGAMTSEMLMKVFNTAEPAVGVLLQSGLMQNGCTVKLFRKGVMLEEEIGYRFSKKIDAPLKSVEELKNSISAIFPAIEVPVVGFESLKGLGFFDMAAANVGGYGCIVGAEIPLGSFDVNAVAMTTTLDGAPFNSGKGTDALGDQWGTLLKLVNIIVNNGYAIEPGQFIISGAMGAMKPAKPGHYTADFGALGRIEFDAK